MMNDAITLRCPRCKSTMQADRSNDDPPSAAVMEIICPNCDDGDFHAPIFFAENGQEVPWYEGVAT